MVDSLRDQLLKSGLVPKASENTRSRLPQRGAKPSRIAASARAPSRPAAPADKRAAEIDLAKAYAIRAQTEAGERRRVEQAAAEQARLKRERKVKIKTLLQGAGLNKPEADQARHFEYGGKIRRIYLDPPQLIALNAGELGVVQHEGRYLLVRSELAAQVGEIEPRLIALLVDPTAPAGEADDGVPDDLIW